MAKLARAASGSRHVRWVREILATLKAHINVNDLLTSDQKQRAQDELNRVNPRQSALSEAVGSYRGYLEGAHVDIRARQRVADFLCDEGQRATDGAMRPHRDAINQAVPGGFAQIFSTQPLSRVLRAGQKRTVRFALDAAGLLRALPSNIPGTGALADRLEAAAGLLDRFIREREDQIDPLRRPLKTAVEKALAAVREELEQMDGRLRGAGFSQAFIDSLYPELTQRNTAVADDEDEDDDDTASPDTTAAA